MRQILAILLILLPVIAVAAPPQYWEGVWQERYGSGLNLQQDGSHVWGEYGSSKRVEGFVDADGRELRGVWHYDNGRVGFFRWTLSEDTQEFNGNWTEYDGSQDGRWWGTKLSSDPEAWTQEIDGQPLIRDDAVRRSDRTIAYINFDDPNGHRRLFEAAMGGIDAGPDPEPTPQPDPQGPLVLGEWSVIGPGPSKLGRVFVEQDRDTGLMFFEGRAIFEKLEPGDALPLEIAQLDDRTASVSVRIPGEKTVTSVARFTEMEGDQFRFELSRGDIVWQDFTFFVTANSTVDRLATRGGPATTGPYRLTNITPGQVVEVRTLPSRGGSVKYLMSTDVTGFDVAFCVGVPAAEWETLRGEALTQAIYDHFCMVHFDDAWGFVGGSLITR